MTISNINKVTNSTYDIYSKLLTLFQYHTGDLDGNTDYLKTGFAGAVIESMAMIMRDSAQHKNMLYNEGFLKTAVIPKSIYNWAKMFDVNITSATPARTSMTLTMTVSELEAMIVKKRASNLTQYGSDVTSLGDTSTFVIDRNNEFVADNYSFSLERSIMITSSGDSGFTIRYINSEPKTTSFIDRSTSYLKYILTTVDGIQYINIDVDVLQYKKIVTTKQIASSSFSETKIHNYYFTDQLCGMSMNYSKNNVNTDITLSYSSLPSTSNFAYYNLVNNNQIQVKFQNGYFIPSTGGTLAMTMYLTKGSAGNIKYSSAVSFSLKDEDYRSLAISVKFSDYQAYGGIDVPSIEDIRTTIINEISNRDVIVTESDLYTYFDTLKTLFENLNNGQITFVKKRSDMIKRVFNTYIMMRESLDHYGNISSSNYIPKIIPTNTVDVTFPISSNMSKPFGTVIKEVINAETNAIEYQYVPDNLINDSDNNNYYVIPFFMRINVSPFKKIKYIYNLTNDTTTLNVTSLTNNSVVIVPSNVNIYRGFTTSAVANNYVVKFTIVSDHAFVSKDGIYIKLYKTPVSPIDVLVPSNEVEIISESTDDGLYENTIIIPLYIMDDEFDFENVSQEYGSFISVSTDKVNTYQIPENAHIGLKLNSYVTGNGSTISLDTTSNNELSVFMNLDNIMSSDITFNTEDTKVDILDDEGNPTGTTVTKKQLTSITISEIPVVHSSFFNNGDDAINTFISQMMSYVSILKENMTKLETNTTFNVKFMNTYGPSLTYNTNTTNIKMELTIYLYNENVEIENEIRDYIRSLVDRSNIEKALKISKIISIVSGAYVEHISHIEFDGLNGTFNQYIEGIETGTIVPEHFNLDTDTIDECIKFEIVE